MTMSHDLRRNKIKPGRSRPPPQENAATIVLMTAWESPVETAFRSGADGATPQETLRHQEPCGLDTLESDGAQGLSPARPSADGESRMVGSGAVRA